MAITTLDGLIGAAKQKFPIHKTATTTSVGYQMTSVIDIAGGPGAGTLNPGNTAAGIVPTDATAGAPTINAFGGGATGYLSRVFYMNSVVSSLYLYDRLFSVGSITMTTSTVTTTLTGQPSFSGRLPTTGGNPDYTGLEIWLEVGGTALSNHAHTVQVNYTNESDASKNTGAISTQNLISRRMFRFPLAAGDEGVKRIDSITANGVASSTGNFNIHVMRPLWQGRVGIAGDGDVDGPQFTGMPQVFADSCLYLLVQPDGTSTGLPYLEVTIVNG